MKTFSQSTEKYFRFLKNFCCLRNSSGIAGKTIVPGQTASPLPAGKRDGKNNTKKPAA